MSTVLSCGAPASPVHLLLDDRVVEHAEGVRLIPGAVVKDAANPLLAEDKPWEVRFDNLYPNVEFDEKAEIYRCWYSPFIVDEVATATPHAVRVSVPYKPGKREMGVCYASSRDGIRWTKPELGLVEFAGSRRNNIVCRGPHGAGILRNPAGGYRMFFRGNGISGADSPDGIHWSEPREFSAIQARGDTHNNAFWARDIGRYVGFTRLWDGRTRVEGRTESSDFVSWSKATEVLRALPAESNRQVYALIAFAYRSLFLGLVMIFNLDTDTVDCELARSTDTVNWERICPGSPLIPRGAPGSCDSGCIYAAAYPIQRPRRLELYYAGSNGPHTNWRDGFLCRARLRPDGFAGIGSTGSVTTRPLACDGGRLLVNADCSRGSLRAEIVDAAGFEMSGCRPISTDVLDGQVQWKGASLASLAGRTVRLRFHLNSATLYSFQFAA